MRRLTLPLILGLAHGVGDGAAGFLLGGLPSRAPIEQVALLVLLYNALAFGGQPLAGMLADIAGRPRAAATGGLLLLCAALAASEASLAATLMAGLGSALFHVGGGALALRATQGRAAGPGLFSAPGVLGLALGGALAAGGYQAAGAIAALLLAVALAVAVMRPPDASAECEATAHHPGAPLFEGHDIVMLVLLGAIALRSAVWSSLELLLHGRWELLLAMALAAALGKILGGILADRLGWRRFATAALLLAAPLLALGGHSPLTLLPGVALLQSATPAMLAALSRAMPRAPATAAGLGLGLAVAAGGVPALAGAGGLIAASPLLLAALLIAAALALGRVLRAPPVRA